MMVEIKKKKKIIFIIPSFRVGGVDRVMCNIINSLDTSLFEITLIVCMGDEKYNRLLALLKVEVNTIILNKNNFRSALPSVYKIINLIRPSLVFTSHNHVGLAILIYRSIFFKKFKIITRISTLPSNNISYVFREKLYNVFFRFWVKKANAIIAQSAEMKAEIENYYRIEKDHNVFAIRNMIDKNFVISQGNISAKKQIKDSSFFTFVAVGALSEVKGFDVLIKAMNKVIKQGITNVRLFIVGGNLSEGVDLEKDLEKLIEDLKLNCYIELLGFKENPYHYLSQADAFVLSSRKEGFPNVVLEALTLGKPCLVTNCVDFKGIIDASNGIVVEKDNIDSLAQGIIDIQRVDVKDPIELVNFDYTKWLLSI